MGGSSLKKPIEHATFQSSDEILPFVVECDASDVAISGMLNQGGRLVAVMSTSLRDSVEEKALAIIEAVRKWIHLLVRQHLMLAIDQCSVAFMLDNWKRSTVKNIRIHG